MSRDTIIPALDADAVALSRLIQRTVRLTNTDDYDAASIELVCRSFSPERVAETITRRAVFLARYDAALAGTVSLGDGKLHALFVDPMHQGRGLGRRLVAHIEDLGRERGLSVLKVSSSITAQAFYQRLGYRLIEYEPRADGSTYLMRKQL